jgi:MFS family permease
MKEKLTAIAVIHQSGHWLSIGLVIPVLAIFQIERGLSLTQLGINGLIYSIMIAALEIPTGGLSDSLGRRRVYLISLFFSLMAAGVFIIAHTPLFIAAGFGIMGIARALSSGCMDAYFIDAYSSLAEGKDLQRFLARLGIFIPLALAFGALAGGFIPDWSGGFSQTVPFFDRYSCLFIVVLISILVQMAITLILIPDDRPSHGSAEIASGISRFPAILHDSFSLGLSNRAVLLLLLGSAAWGVSFAGLEQFWQPFVDNITIGRSPTRLFGYLTTGYFLVGSLGAMVSSRLFRIIGDRYGTAVGVLRVVMGGLFALLSLTRNVPFFALIYLAIFFLNGVNDSPEQTMFNLRVPASARSTLLSFQSLFMQLGGGTAGLIFGIISERYSIGLSWRIGGLLFALSGILFFRADVKPQTTQDTQA